MIPGLLSVIIPSRNERHLQMTIDGLLNGAEGDIEIIVALDGYWPEPQIVQDMRVVVLHCGGLHSNFGMRYMINRGVEVSRGQYIMKVDEHCLFEKGFDLKLKADCEDNWVVTPRRYKTTEEWDFLSSSEDPVDAMYMDMSLNGHQLKTEYLDRKDILINDCMLFQGSCYFMTRKHWDWLGGLNDQMYGSFDYEAQEICLKTWLGGGRVITNKKTWYAHLHRREPRGFRFSNAQTRKIYGEKSKNQSFVVDYWWNNKWEERVHDLEWLIKKFWPIPDWPADWREGVHKLIK